jgi:phosphatidate cytidylyltransferase
VALGNLAQRAISAAIALPLIALLILWSQPWGFGALVLVAAALGLREYAAITLPSAGARLRVGVIVLGTALTAGLYVAPGFAIVWVLAAFVATAALVLFDPGDIPAAGARLGIAAFGVFYLGLLCAPMAIMQRDAPHGRAWVMLAIALTFSNDTGAYFAGRALGRHKLYPAVSPAKTVEGAVGGMLAGLLVILAARALFVPWLTLRDCFLAALPAGVIGPIGDLVESLIKRAFGVKDSGKLIPGHGGMLDRIDALLFVAAWLYVYTLFLR